ncbi:MAG: cobalt-precorrin-6A reductase [SAR324 cluster bacterium]|nr:cobalt-precorrin-6A reductase [SAR324 cluster bacterium]MBL7034440.1 cobalt-precorrin-6A reductase [SAR324 cluster bacterium]
MPEKLLILGGTSEAYKLAERLVSQYSSEQLTVITSLAGVTGNPKLPAGEVRIGGFSKTSGVDGKTGLHNYLQQENISLLINATHPYAIQISENALAAATELGLAYLRLTRPPWLKHSGDQWIEVADLPTAAEFLKNEIEISYPELSAPVVFLTTGNRGLEIFQQCSTCNFVVRTVELPQSVTSATGISAWENATFLQARGPFSLEHELALFRQYGVTLLVSKNSGGDSTYAKIEAARKLKIPVVMLDRPAVNSADLCLQVNQVLEWIVQHKSV